ncbi:uncharacterized protein PHACADRAFT_214866 [Phanerochaete carnosa HHB-10118-sp]|uniref:Uncharacterized protein n=1 Tax=Phanerochaete carnosa (strain HHB-10118-sp) TaxID=650164 RepID=K5WDT6_PHACS|nr:uncharacterized protein PHACADRAFT_214866 [Phanerochaete carnosa HHB-10118-sp]EKM48297.1 hypothetical protein PHACADRAFT_214866 [Phanerochaete carnosa HHB-10118-sp]
MPNNSIHKSARTKPTRRKKKKGANTLERKQQLADQDNYSTLTFGSPNSESPGNRLREAKSTRNHRRLIPEPTGEPGHGGDKGYNLQKELLPEDNSDRYNRLRLSVRKRTPQYLNMTKTLSRQPKLKLAHFVQKMVKKFPYFQDFEDGWPVRAILYGYLGNSAR